MVKVAAQNNFSYLTTALVLLLLASALSEQFAAGYGAHLIEAATVLALATGVWSIRRDRWLFRTGIGFGTGVLVVTLLSIFMKQAGLGLFQLGLMLGFFLITTWVAGRKVLTAVEIDRNKIVGAVCLYLLLGMIWTTLFLIAEELQPGSFNGLRPDYWYNNFSDAVYFSFVTLTTLGYGDITPALPLPRFLVYMEAVIGQFYLAIMVASLVAMQISARLNEGRPAR